MHRQTTITPTDIETRMSEEDLIVSKTDTSGRIVYANECFCRFSKYNYSDMRGKSHNIVRHPCMPRAIFDLMWEHLKQEKEFLGYIKNLAQDGSYYWTFASIQPTYDNGTVIGYTSFRRAPSTEALAVIRPIYENMRQAEITLPDNQQVPMSSAILWREISPRYQSYAEFILSL